MFNVDKSAAKRLNYRTCQYGTGDGKHTRRRALVRTQHRPLIEILQKTNSCRWETEPGSVFWSFYCNRIETRTESSSQHGSQGCFHRVGGVLHVREYMRAGV
jgi:hypothetical protein